MSSESIPNGLGQLAAAIYNLNPLRSITRSFEFRKKYKSYLLNITKKEGNCYCCPVPKFLTSDKEGRSKLMLFENGVPLRHPHSMHAEIEQVGSGRYSHWESWILFSTSDNSDPSSNGKVYSVKEMNY